MPSGGWRGGGRPQGSTSRKPTKRITLNIRMTEEEKAEIERRAQEKGMTVSEYVRRRVVGEER